MNGCGKFCGFNHLEKLSFVLFVSISMPLTVE